MKTFLKKNYAWIIFLVLVSAGSMAANIINHRLDLIDLEVYYRAAERIMQGNELYRTIEEDPYEHYVYKYSPPAALLFIPLTFLGFQAAKVVYWVVLTLTLFAILLRLKYIFARINLPDKSTTWAIILVILISGTHIYRELELGQVNLLLTGMFVIALHYLLKHNNTPAAALLALSIFIKPFGLIFLPLLIVYKRYRAILYIMVFMIVFFFLPMLFYHDFEQFIHLYSSWINELLIEMEDKQELLMNGNHTIFSVLARHFGLEFVTGSAFLRYIYQLLLLLIIAFIFLWHIFKRKVDKGFARLYIIFIAIIPLLAYTSANAFIFTLPLLLYLLFNFRQFNIYYKILFIISAILIGGNIYDLLGRELSEILWNHSVYTWGTIGLLIIVFGQWKSVGITKKE